MAIGKVKWFDAKRVLVLLNKTVVGMFFVHYSNIAGDGFKTLEDGEKVEFDYR